MKKITHTNGFTLIELTIVMGIFIIIGTIIVSILANTFRGNTKTRVSNDISQNGNYALTLISNLLYNSRKFQSITPVSGPVVTTCAPTGTQGKTIVFSGFDGGTTTLSCNDTTSFNISSNSASLIDTSQVRIAANSCIFTCTQVDEYSPPRIDVSFTLENSSGGTQERQGSATFRTSISLRNQDLRL